MMSHRWFLLYSICILHCNFSSTKSMSCFLLLLLAMIVLNQSWSVYCLIPLTLDIMRIGSSPVDLIKVLDMCDTLAQEQRNVENSALLSEKLISNAKMVLLNAKKYNILTNLLKTNRDEYIATVNFAKNRLSRRDLPNVQDIDSTLDIIENNVLNDCALPLKQFEESILDKILLGIFRSIVHRQIGFKSPTSGIKGLLEEGRYYMLSEDGRNTTNQHIFVKNTLGALLTPIMPPFYRLFMSGFVPSIENNDPKWLVDLTNQIISALPKNNILIPGKQIGPWFYAPLLTSIVTPPFLAFLVGPSRINLRKDGNYGGMLVEKCKFLQESGCKGLCLHQCKLPAQQFFKDTLGLPLTVTPNFNTQECQWSWGETPLDPENDPSFPVGCLNGCETRKSLNAISAGKIC